MKEYFDNKGKKIESGDTLYNPFDKNNYQKVITDGKDLFLGDLESPLKKYNTKEFWMKVEESKECFIS